MFLALPSGCVRAMIPSIDEGNTTAVPHLRRQILKYGIEQYGISILF